MIQAAIRIMGFSLFGIILATIPSVRAQDPSEENKRLKARIVELESRLKLQEKQIDLLKRELDQLRPSKNKLLESINKGTILTGTFENLNNAKRGEITLKVTERNKDRLKAEWTINYSNAVTMSDLEGTISGQRLSFRTVNQKDKILVTLVFADDLFEGSWFNSTVKAIGPATMKISK